MKKQFYRLWNWEFDYGIDVLPDDQPLPSKFAVAYYDHLERLYRAEVWEELSHYNSPDETKRFDVSRYDYFCDMNGVILQKRSLGDDNEVFLIVDYEYFADADNDRVRETAWLPINNTCKSIERPFRSGHEEHR